MNRLLHNAVICDLILCHLPPSDIQTMLYTDASINADQIPSRWLDPIRQMGRYEKWISEKLSEGCRVRLIGKDVQHLVDTISNPAEYWRRGGDTRATALWLAVTPRRHNIVEVDEDQTVALMDGEESVEMAQSHGLALYGPRCPYKSPFFLPPEVADQMRLEGRHWVERRLDNQSRMTVMFYSIFEDQTPGMYATLGAERMKKLMDKMTCAHLEPPPRSFQCARWNIQRFITSRQRGFKYKTAFISLGPTTITARFAHENSERCGKMRLSGMSMDCILLLLEESGVGSTVRELAVPLIEPSQSV